jgi:sec-independent protein translocase protein TatA
MILVAVGLLIFGPKRLPEMGSALGKTIKEFQRSFKEMGDSVTSAGTDIPAPRPRAAVPAPTDVASITAPTANPLAALETPISAVADDPIAPPAVEVHAASAASAPEAALSESRAD